jgi:hypothetical protein
MKKIILSVVALGAAAVGVYIIANPPGAKQPLTKPKVTSDRVVRESMDGTTFVREEVVTTITRTPAVKKLSPIKRPNR